MGCREPWRGSRYRGGIRPAVLAGGSRPAVGESGDGGDGGAPEEPTAASEKAALPGLPLRPQPLSMTHSSDTPLIEIALADGFVDQSHLTNTFRRRMGITPAEFRRNIRACRFDT